ncbi:MAG: DsbC family protein [Pontibacterium sp.]
MKIYMALLAALLSFSGVAAAQSLKEIEDKIKSTLGQAYSNVEVVSVSDMPVEGMYEIVVDSGGILYTNKDVEFFVIGQFLHSTPTEGIVDLTALTRDRLRLESLAALTEDQMVVYPAKGERKATLTVFTDVDCAYCRKLHAEVPDLNEQGIQVNYLAFPRSGANSRARYVMDAIWCAGPEKRLEYMDQAKSNQSIPMETCNTSPVLDQYALGRMLGVNGTPALLLEDGRMIPGYVPKERLIPMLFSGS